MAAIARVCYLGNEIQAQKFMMAAEADRTRRFMRWMSLPLHVVSAFTGSGSAFNASMNYESMSWQEFLLHLFVILSTVLTAVNAACAFGAKLTALDTCYFRANEMANKVHNFVVHSDTKSDAEIAMFLETLTLEYEHTQEGIPVISQATKDMLSAEMVALGEDVSPDAIHLLQAPNTRHVRTKRDILKTPKRPPPIHISNGSDTSEQSDDVFKKEKV